MDVKVQSLKGEIIGQGRMVDAVAMGLQIYDQVVFTFIEGCWIILVRQLVIRSVDGGVDLTLVVKPRNP